MKNVPVVTTRPEHRFEHREDKGQKCEGCGSSYTRESHFVDVYRCPKCEAYFSTFDALAQSYAAMLEQWRVKMSLSREGALQHAREFDGLFSDIQEFLMDGYSMQEYAEQRALLYDENLKDEAA